MRLGAVLVAGAMLLGACEPAGDEPPDTPAREQAEPTPTGTADPGGEETAAPGDALPADRWTTLPEAPLALSEVAAAGFAGQVWTAGGFTADGEASTRVQVFDPTFESWSDGPALPEAVHHAALVATDRGLYLVGGYTGSGFDVPTTAVRRLDPAVGRWEDGPPLPEARAAGAAAWDGRRVVYGGGAGPGGLSGEVLALEDGAWTVVGSLSEPREHLAAAADGDGRAWFLGGRTAGLDTNVAAVDLVEGGDVRRVGELPTPRGGIAGWWSAATGACAVGGEDAEGTFAEVECVDAGGEVRLLPSLAAPRHGLGAVVVDGIAYAVLGGPEPGLTVSATVEALRLTEQ